MQIIGGPIDVLGIAGGFLILFGFYRITSGTWSSRSIWYELDNLTGATFLAIYQLHHRAYVTVVINVVYAAVALMGLNSYGQRKKMSAIKVRAGSKRRRTT